MEAQPKTNIQILVVDDEPSVRAALSLLLKYEGHEVRTADCGEAALLMLGQHEFDIVITDFFMPGIKPKGPPDGDGGFLKSRPLSRAA